MIGSTRSSAAGITTSTYTLLAHSLPLKRRKSGHEYTYGQQKSTASANNILVAHTQPRDTVLSRQGDTTALPTECRDAPGCALGGSALWLWPELRQRGVLQGALCDTHQV